MATIGSINIILSASSEAFTKAIERGEEAIQSIREKVESAHLVIEGLLAGVGIGLGADEIKEQMEKIESTFKVAQSLKIPNDVLGELQSQAFIEAGLGAEEFDADLLKLNKTLGEAKLTGGSAAAALGALKLKASDFSNTGDAFQKIADRLSGIADSSIRGRIETELLGKQGQALDPLFLQGADGIRKALDEAINFGTALNNIDAAKVAMADESFKKLKESAEGVETSLSVVLAPILGTIADKIVGTIPQAAQLRSDIVDGINESAIALGYVVRTVDVLKTSLLTAAQATIAIGDAAETNFRIFAWINEEVAGDDDPVAQAITAKADAWGKSLDQTYLLVKKMADDAKSVTENFDVGFVEKWVDDILIDADRLASQFHAKAPAVFEPMSDAAQKSADKIKDILDGLDAKIKGFGQSDTILNLMKLGASPAQIGQATLGEDRLALMKDQSALDSKIGDFGKSGPDLDVDKIRQSIAAHGGDLGLLSASMDQLAASARKLDVLNDTKKAMDEIAQIVHKADSPMQIFADRLATLTHYLNEGAISKVQFNLAQTDAMRDRDKNLEFTSVGTFDSRALPGLVALSGGGEGDAANKTAENTANIADSMKSIDSKLDLLGRFS